LSDVFNFRLESMHHSSHIKVTFAYCNCVREL
jgi:hypothetical protein